MDRPVRIALVGASDERLLGDLRQLPLRPEVRPLSSLVADTETLMRLQPEVLLVQLGAAPDEDVGAIRLLQRLWPQLRVALITTAERELETAPIARRLAAQLLVYPDAPGHLAASIERLLQDGDRPGPELFVDLAHGLADEINNPLLFVSGHLQLLRAQLVGDGQHDRRDQVDAALSGLRRIQSSVDRLRLLSQAATGPGDKQELDLAELLHTATGRRTADATTAAIRLEDGPQTVTGNRDQLQLAISALVDFADELAALTGDCELSLGAVPRQDDARAAPPARRLRLLARGQQLLSWRLPNTFEPYYPQRLVRGRSHGLGLFLLQTIVLGHRGQATARRRQDGTLQFDFVLPG